MRTLLLSLLMLSSPAMADDLDLVFLLDTTGSMSGELRAAKERVRQIAKALEEANPDDTLRVGVVAYRDRTDDYITKVSALDADIEVSFRFLAGLKAQGGGDGPEDVLSGLHASIHDVGWSTDSGVQRQVFLIGDAPPHLDYSGHYDADTLLAQAREQRVVFHAIGCRSLSGSGMQFFRKVAFETEGRYQHIGRVSVDDGGLAEAMISTLTAAPEESDPGTPMAVHPNSSRPPTSAMTLEGRGLFVRLGNWWDAKEVDEDGVTKACLLTTLVPEGMAIDGKPAVAVSDRGLEATLSLKPGKGAVQSWELGRCLPIDTPVIVRFEEAS